MQRVEVAIVGAGFAGLGAAIRLDQAGIADFVLLERAADVGGTWRDNRYPGAACDVASHLYSFSFALNPDWSHTHAQQPEIQAYLQRVTDDCGLRERIRVGAKVAEARLDEQTGRWTLRCTDGHVVEARFVIHSIGGLKDPRWPAIPGLDEFAGPVVHTARWDPALDVRGQRVGCIGTGASAIQVVPELAHPAAHVTVFQRTPPWVIPRNDKAFSPVRKAAFRHVPGLMKLERLRLYLKYESRYPLLFSHDTVAKRMIERLVRWHIAKEVEDPALAAAVTPDYRMGCKRVLVSDDWYATLSRSDVSVENRRVASVVTDGVVLEDGTHVPLDALVCCTGFTVDQPLGDMDVYGLGGQSLRDLWTPRPKAHLGMTAPGFPNAFVLLGPNTALGHNSVIVMIEAQLRYVLQAIEAGRALPEGQWLDLQDDALDAFIDEVDRRHRGQVWASGCDSWYLGDDAVNFTIWPGSTLEYMWRTRRFDAEHYDQGGVA